MSSSKSGKSSSRRPVSGRLAALTIKYPGCSGPFDEGTAVLQPGDRLYLYSDGITEHASQEGSLFGQNRLFRKLESLKILPLEPSCEKIIESLRNFSQGDPLKDDVTMIGIEYNGVLPEQTF